MSPRIVSRDPQRLARIYTTLREVFVGLAVLAVFASFGMVLYGQQQIRELSSRQAAAERRDDLERTAQEKRAAEAGAAALAIARRELARHDAETRASLEQIIRAIMAELFGVENQEHGSGPRRVVYVQQPDPSSTSTTSSRPDPKPRPTPRPSPSPSPPFCLIVCP